VSKGVGRKFSRVGQRKKGRKIGKNTKKLALLSLFQGGEGATKKILKNSKKSPKNSTIKPLSTISMQCMKIQEEDHGPSLPSAADAHVCERWFQFFLRTSKF